jgi:UDPglucose--hexose-1-phosphate uridylyltransferase
VSELRKDPFLTRWVVLAPEREKRPRSGTPEACPFCPGHESETPPEVLALGRARGAQDSPGWTVRVIPNKYPAFVRSPETPVPHPPFLSAPARGVHEVMVTSPDHTAHWGTFSDAQGVEVLRAVSMRRDALAALAGIEHVVLFENAGDAAGRTLSHPHLQLVGLPILPPVLTEELRAGEAEHAARGCCPYCSWIEAELPSGARVLEAGPDVVTLVPFAPRFPFEFWILPRGHAAAFPGPGDPLLGPIARALRTHLARLTEVLPGVSYNWILHSLLPGAAHPAYHWHIEVLPRTVHTGGFEWGTGMFLHHLPPEEALRRLRGEEV